MATIKGLAFASASVLLVAISVGAVEGASKSPFASKKPKAWEQAPTPPSSGQYVPPSQHAPQPYSAPQYAPSQPSGSQPQTYQQPQNYGTYQAPKNYGTYQSPSVRVGAPQGTPQPSMAGGYYPGKQPAGEYKRPVFSQQQAPAQPQYQNYQGQSAPYGQQQGHSSQRQQPQHYANLRGASKPSWSNRLGLGNVETDISGYAKVGVAAVDKAGSNVTAESIVDLSVRGEISAITEGGLEYGAGLRVRGQRDRHRRGFGGRVGDCPASDVNCASVSVNGAARSVKGHTGQFYTDGASDAKETEFALEGAYLFLRSSYGDMVLGRDDGSAYLFSLGAPSLVSVNASNSSVDYTGYDSVKTLNDASGFSEKIAYTSPRLLGDTVGVGVQFGLSYAPNARACGVNYCVRKNSDVIADPFSPQIKDVIEAGLSLDRKFNNGFSVELAGTYARGSEDTGHAAFTDLKSYGVGLELEYSDFVFGTSYLKSNNGFAGDGDYTAYDAGLTWKPSNWGFTASYGHGKDEIAKLSSDQGVLAISYDFGKFRLGSGVQYVSRKVPLINAGALGQRKEEATALFIEGGIKF